MVEAIRGNARQVCKESDRNCHTIYRTDRDGERERLMMTGRWREKQCTALHNPGPRSP